jgi:hypothetical protein
MLYLIVEDHIFILSNADHPGDNELLKPSDIPERHTIGIKENYSQAEGLYVCLGKGYLELLLH